jgi:bifunctional enzyme CysN/CysC
VRALAAEIHPAALAVSATDREAQLGQVPCVLWLTGLSGAGKSTLAWGVDAELSRRGHDAYVLDGDNVRRGLSRDLGFSDEDRVENIRRVAEVARLMADAGVIVICSLISPFRAERQMARDLFADGRFIEVFVDVPLEVAEARDPKGLYSRARRGEIANFTGIDSPYEPPETPEARLDSAALDPAGMVEALIELLECRHLLPVQARTA